MRRGKIHVCTVCGKSGLWDPQTWSWFGSAREIDEEIPVIKVCSSHCRERAINQEPTMKQRLAAKEKEYRLNNYPLATVIMGVGK